MGDFVDFLKALLSHWPWLLGSIAAVILLYTEDWRGVQTRIALGLIAIACLVTAFFLTARDQYEPLLKARERTTRKVVAEKKPGPSKTKPPGSKR